jgi:hypothetical protein
MILGAATATRGDGDRGVALLEEALAVARRSGDRWLQASCLGYNGIALASGGRLAAGRAALEEGLTVVRELGDDRCVGWMLIALGRIARGAGDAEQAMARVHEAQAVQQRLGDVWGIGNALCERAALAVDAQGDHDAARALLVESLELALRVLDRPTIAAGLHGLARLSACRTPVRAAQLLGGASTLDRALNDPLARLGGAESWITDLRASVGDGPFVDAWERGRAMTVHEAVAYALADEAVTA